ncbi:HeH/LEM domain-containing protein [Falsirhodobacter sp. 1013]|uniref:HeH/LEM domain-containing protein n=1 Tax=Falsirhodobacter sp. 1013 TaxID=3417566 RepID=UPI003EBCEF04
MRIRITKPGIYGSTGEVAVGTEFDVKEEPTGWAGRYDVIGAGEGGEPVLNGPDLDKLTVEELKAMLTDKGVTIPEGAKKADLIALAKG